jgi:hypothetical protein
MINSKGQSREEGEHRRTQRLHRETTHPMLLDYCIVGHVQTVVGGYGLRRPYETYMIKRVSDICSMLIMLGRW